MRELQSIPSYQQYNRFIEGQKFNNQYYLVRHGQSEANVNGMLCNRLSSPAKLTEQGVCEAKEVAKKLTTLQFAKEKIRLFSSPLTRATQTAKHISERLGIAYQTDTELRERCYGNWEGTKITPEKIKAVSTRDLENPFHNFENIEPLMEVTRRITAWIMNFDSTHIGFIVIIISHFNVITMAINALERAWPGRELSIKHTEIYPLITQTKYSVNHFKREQLAKSVANLTLFSKSYHGPADQEKHSENIHTLPLQQHFFKSQL